MSDFERFCYLAGIDYNYNGKEYKDTRSEYNSLKAKISLELEHSPKNAQMLHKLDQTLRTRAINYKRHGHHEVYENTMSLYQIIFGREM